MALKVPVTSKVLPEPPKLSVEFVPCFHVEVATEPVMPFVLLAVNVPLFVIVVPPLIAVVPKTVTAPPAVIVTGPLIVRLPVIEIVLVDEKFGEVAPLIVNVPLFVVAPVPLIVEVAPETVTPPDPSCVPLFT